LVVLGQGALIIPQEIQQNTVEGLVVVGPQEDLADAHCREGLVVDVVVKTQVRKRAEQEAPLKLGVLVEVGLEASVEQEQTVMMEQVGQTRRDVEMVEVEAEAQQARG
jgi:hypothetical protein